ncbi:motility protein A [Demequina mangrovi]|uniref:Chemotaxis protein MotA n=1 Tax=Demequina mangrovi TaxID=1043493 RepID=A0A1H6ZWS1_9MICO|nr:MotA/TolQ/ExbB proton channel family protein [Demequina mangrovi]SEJ56077.1 chemotaxis protein MotA [Demequina mangrovi]
MDPATFVGMAIAFGAIIVSIFLEGSSPMSVILPAPMLLVIGGTIGAGLATTTLPDFIAGFTSLGRYLTYKRREPGETVDLVVSLADRARREGLLALEDAARDVDDDFLRDGLQSAIDGTDPEDLRAMMEAKIDGRRAADRSVAKLFSDMGGFAPTIGIIGTVVSLVHVLENLADPSSIGHMIAAAFVATLWGLLSANLIWLPIASRVKRVSELETGHMELAMEGMLAIQAGSGPRVVDARLRALVGDPGAKEAA